MKYYLTVGRIVGFKGVDLAIEACKSLGVKLKVVGEYAGIYTEQKKIKKIADGNIEFLGRVPDEQLKDLYREATAFLALAKDEDFGIVPVEAMAAGTPVIAYKGGGYLETVVEGKTGVFFDEYSVESLVNAIKKFNSITRPRPSSDEVGKFKKADCIKQAQKFSRKVFIKKMKEIVYARIA